jgi:hypothetical protein
MGDMSTAPKHSRRWYQFGLRAMFVVVTVFASVFGFWFMAIGQRRQARRWIEDHGGGVPEYAAALAMTDSDYSIPRWREWLGDETALVVFVPESASKEEEEWIRRRFPEAEIVVRVDRDDPKPN